MDRLVDPVGAHERRRVREIGGCIARRGLGEAQQQQRRSQTECDIARRTAARPADPLDVHPHAEQQGERYADVQEDQQREQPVAHGARADEVARQRLAEEGQRVEPLGRRDQAELGEAVPYEPVPAEAGRVGEPKQRHPRQPREPAEPLRMAVHPFTHHVQQYHERERIGRVPVQAPREAAQRPLAVRDPLDRGMRAGDAGVERRIDVRTGGRDDPEQEERRGAEMPPRIRTRAERLIECELDPLQRPLERQARSGAARCGIPRGHRGERLNRGTRIRPAPGRSR